MLFVFMRVFDGTFVFKWISCVTVEAFNLNEHNGTHDITLFTI